MSLDFGVCGSSPANVLISRVAKRVVELVAVDVVLIRVDSDLGDVGQLGEARFERFKVVEIHEIVLLSVPVGLSLRHKLRPVGGSLAHPLVLNVDFACRTLFVQESELVVRQSVLPEAKV